MANPVFLDPIALDFSRIIEPPSDKILKTADQFLCHQGRLYRLVGMEAVAKGPAQGVLARMGRAWNKIKNQTVYLPAQCGLMPELYASFFQRRVHHSDYQKGGLLQADHLLSQQPLECLKNDAEKNEPGALYLLGTLSNRSEKSRYLLKVALARQDYPYASYEIGRRAEKDSQPNSLQEAIRSYQTAAEHHHMHACYRLGLIYQKQQNDEQSFKCFKKAASLGAVWAQYELGCMYEQGKGVKANVREALQWYGTAADQGYPLGMYRFWFLFNTNKMGVPHKEQVEQCYHERAKDYLRQAATAGIMDAQFEYGMTFVRGLPGMAGPWLKQAADKGHVEAMYRFGLLCTRYPAEFHLAEGIPYLKEAAKEGDTRAYLLLNQFAHAKGYNQAFSRIKLSQAALAAHEAKEKEEEDFVQQGIHKVQEWLDTRSRRASQSSGFPEADVHRRRSNLRDVAILESESKDDTDPKDHVPGSAAVVPFKRPPSLIIPTDSDSDSQ